MINKTIEISAYDLKETARALIEIIEQCSGPESNNPNRLDLAAIERVNRLITEILTETVADNSEKIARLLQFFDAERRGK